MNEEIAAAMIALNEKIARCELDYSFEAVKVNGRFYQVRAATGRPWFYPPSYGADMHTVKVTLRKIENISRFVRKA